MIEYTNFLAPKDSKREKKKGSKVHLSPIAAILANVTDFSQHVVAC